MKVLTPLYKVIRDGKEIEITLEEATVGEATEICKKMDIGAYETEDNKHLGRASQAVSRYVLVDHKKSK